MSARGGARLALAAALLLGANVAQAGDVTPSAADVEEAKRHYARGVQLYNQGADAAALAELERAYKLAPTYKVLYNLGLVELQMNDFAAALRSFEQYLAEGAAQVEAARRREVEGRIAQLRDQVATLTVDAGTDGAEITLDDVAVGISPLAHPLLVNPGHHKVGATKGGRSAETKMVSVAGADHAQVELSFEEPPPVALITPPPLEPVPYDVPASAPTAPSAPSTVAAAPPASERAPHREIWIGWVTTGALASGAVVTGLAALDAKSQLTRAKNDGPTSGSDLEHLSSRAHAFALASDILSGTAIVAGGISIYLTVREKRSAQAAPRAEHVEVGFGPANVTVRGTF